MENCSSTVAATELLDRMTRAIEITIGERAAILATERGSDLVTSQDVIDASYELFAVPISIPPFESR